MASSSLGTLTLDLIARTGGFVKGMTKAERASQKWRKQVERDLKRLRGNFNKFAKVAAGAGVAAAGAFTILAKEGLQFVDSQAKMAARIGTTVNDLRALQIAASDYGIEQGQLSSSLASYTKRLGDAARGTGEAQKAYEALGLEASELVNMPLPEQMALIAERISEVDSAAERASIADRLMSGGREMVLLFAEGGEAISDAADEVKALGLELSEIETDRVERANDQMSRIALSTEGVRNQLVVRLAPAIETVADQFNDAAKEAKGFSEEGGNIGDNIIDGATFAMNAVDGLGRTFELAGITIALWAIESQRFMLEVANTVYSGPINAVNDLIEQMNRIPGIDLGLVEQFDAVNEIRQQIALLEGAGDQARKDLQDTLLQPLAGDAFAVDLARNESLQAGRDAGLGLEGGVSTEAITAAIELSDAMKDVTESVEDSTEKNKDAADAVKGLEDSSNFAASALDGIGRADWGKGALPGPDGDDESMSPTRRALERSKDLSAYWLQNDDTGRPTWSTEGLPPIQEAPAFNFGSVAPRGAAAFADEGAARMNSRLNSIGQGISSSSGGGGDGGRPTNRGSVHVTVTKDGNTQGGEVEGEDQFIRHLANALSGVAAGSR